MPARQHSCSGQGADQELVQRRQRGRQEVLGQGDARCWLLRPAEADPALTAHCKLEEGNPGAKPPAPSLWWTSQLAKWVLLLASEKGLEAFQ